MRDTRGRLQCLLLTIMTAAPAFEAGLAADTQAWKNETVLVSRQRDQTIVESFDRAKVLFRNTDPQLAMEWALANSRNTVVLAGKYPVADSVEVPRDGVTLIIARGAEISLDPDTEHRTDIGFRSRRHPGFWKIVPLIYNRGHNNVRVIHLGKLLHFVRADERHGEQTFPIVFDGRNDKRTCGVEGGTLVVAGSIQQTCLLLDARRVNVPLVVVTAGIDAILCLEGCEECMLGLIANLAAKPGGTAGETVDLNSSNRAITIERLMGERSQEIIDSNGSQVVVNEIVSVGRPRKFLCFTVGSGPRWTSRPRAADRIDVLSAAVLEEPADVSLTVEAPEFPDALPRFTIKATIRITLKNGARKTYAREVEIDLTKGT